MPAPNIFTIPPHRGFADALVAGLLARAGADRMALARGLVLLPNNRAVIAVRDAFVRRAAEGLLLPRLAAIGDVGLDERLGPLFDPIGAGEPVLSAIEPLRRQLILAELVQRARADRGDPIDAAEAMRLAADLARVVDQLHGAGIDPARLRGAVDLDMAEHWQRSLDVLETVLSRWPERLRALGLIDPAERRERLLDRLAERWAAAPLPGPVAAAGIALATPATARLLRCIAFAEQGLVVLPGVDLSMPDAEWDALGPQAPEPETGRARPSVETHPQYHLKLLLDRIGVRRGEVARWRRGGRHDAPAVRGRAVAHALAPAGFTARWETLPPAERRLTGIRAAEFATAAEEAQGIALAIRETLERPGETVALVTPDRGLARRVVAHLGRWGIAADDSAGRPLSVMPPGALILLIAEAAAERFAPVALLALLKHPLVRSGEGRLAWLDEVRRLDRALRGPRPDAGLDGVTRYLRDGAGRDATVRAPARAGWEAARALLEPLEAAFAVKLCPSPEGMGPRGLTENASSVEGPHPNPSPEGEGLGKEAGLRFLLAAIREAGERLAGDALWEGPAGRAAAELFERLEASAEGPALGRAENLPLLLRGLMDGIAIRPPQGGHPRVFVWGLLEARLQRADLMILGGLNEGVWPAPPAPDPWLSPRVRAALGLEGLDVRTGLAAHGFAEALGGRRVLVTRARRDTRSPTLASRFWLRLEAMTGGMTRVPRLAGWARSLDRPEGPTRPADRPAPAPRIDQRPTRIAVTRLDRLKADPFSFYADAMLRLSALDAVDADPSPAWRGTAVHAVFEEWMKQDGCDPDRLRARAEAMLAGIAPHPVLRVLWEPRLLEAIDWAAAEMRVNLAEGRRPLVAERWGEAGLGGVTVYGKVDRIDRMADGSLAIVDYKTGKPPSTKQVKGGFALQLGLLGLIAEAGGVEGARGVPGRFEYWSLARGTDGTLGYVKDACAGRGEDAIDPARFTALAAKSLAEAAARWLTGGEPFTAKLHPELAPYGDYDQLMRLDEWYGRDVGSAQRP